MKSIINDSKACMFCGRPAEIHHVFFGNPGRKNSEREGLKVPLCAWHHKYDPEHSPHLNREWDLELKRTAQAKFEEGHSREEFIRLFGKSYL